MLLRNNKQVINVISYIISEIIGIIKNKLNIILIKKTLRKEKKQTGKLHIRL